jgi:hypothetical protein
MNVHKHGCCSAALINNSLAEVNTKLEASLCGNVVCSLFKDAFSVKSIVK